MQTVRLLAVKLFLGTMRPLGLLRIELWRLSFPSMLKTRGRRAFPSGVGLHPALPLGCSATGCSAKVASMCRCAQVYACCCRLVRASTSAASTLHTPATCQRQSKGSRQPTLWMWKLHYVCCVNASPERSEPSVYYRMVVFRIKCTALFQVLRGAWSAILRLCSHCWGRPS